MKCVLGLFMLCLLACTENKYAGIPEKYHALLDQALVKAGDNATELTAALKNAPDNQKEGMAFLIAYMPERDLKELTADFLLENTAYAYQAREKYVWAREIPDTVFLNDVLPYVSLNETREGWRKEFYERFGKYVQHCKTILKPSIRSTGMSDEVLVDYNTKRENRIRVRSNPCGSIWLVPIIDLADGCFPGCRIPSRWPVLPIGTTNGAIITDRGLGRRKLVFYGILFSGQLNNAWFFADAESGKNDQQKAIYASSFKPTGTYFPLVWDENIRYVPAANVTDFYTDLYKSHLETISADGNHVPLRIMMFTDNACVQNSEDRVAANLDIFCGKLQMGGGRTAGPTQDMNDVLTFMLEKNQTYTVKYANEAGKMKEVEVKLGEQPVELKLYMK
ncbi:MAG: transglutaminase domain-containing protein [Odoribacter splanchnicus]